MDLNDLLVAFCEKSGLARSVPNSSGLHRLVFDERWAVDIEERHDDGKSILLVSAVGPIPPTADATVLRRCLGANLFARRANDAFVALDTHGNELVAMCRHDTASMDLEAFELALRDFVDQMERWNEFLLAGEARPVSEAGPNPAANFIRG